MKKRIAALLLSLALLPALASGCAREPQLQALDLTKAISAREIDTDGALIESSALAATDFCVELFQESCLTGDNALLSPVSVLYAMAMAANGAQGNTLAQLEEAVGMTIQDLDRYLAAFQKAIPRKRGINIANSLWLRDTEDLTVEESFLQTNADYFDPDIYLAPFDGTTVSDINRWVDARTDGMIPQLVDELPEATVFCLINALSFEQKWEEVYQKDQVRPGTFTLEDGTERTVELMYSEESYFLEDEDALGLLKYYEGRDYAFVALLPEEGTSLTQYAAALTGEKLRHMLSNIQEGVVSAALPKFQMEDTLSLAEPLAAMGITDAFDPGRADFSALGSCGNDQLYISQVLHKAFLSVDEQKTKAAAATFMAGDAGDCFVGREIILDRPFLCLLIHCETGLPLFMGAVMDIGQ